MKPTEAELKRAVATAEAMRDQGNDPEALAKTLLYLLHRDQKLEKVLDAANQYVRFGQDQREHALLLQAIESAREQELHEQQLDKESFGL